jgi:uncharacterized protein (TIGR03435 family)
MLAFRNGSTTDLYAVDARAAGNPTKDQIRLMVQSMLADRFKFTAHFENKDVPVFALTLAKAGERGPKLRSHDDGPRCDPAAIDAPTATRVIRGDDTGGSTFPPMCDALLLIRKSGGALRLAGYRNATMGILASSLAGIVGQGRPVIDKTGLSGTYDFTMEWAPETNGGPPSNSPAPPPDLEGPTPLQALRDQLGLRLEPTRGTVQILVIDKVERPSEN